MSLNSLPSHIADTSPHVQLEGIFASIFGTNLQNIIFNGLYVFKILDIPDLSNSSKKASKDTGEGNIFSLFSQLTSSELQAIITYLRRLMGEKTYKAMAFSGIDIASNKKEYNDPTSRSLPPQTLWELVQKDTDCDEIFTRIKEISDKIFDKNNNNNLLLNELIKDSIMSLDDSKSYQYPSIIVDGMNRIKNFIFKSNKLSSIYTFNNVSCKRIRDNEFFDNQKDSFNNNGNNLGTEPIRSEANQQILDKRTCETKNIIEECIKMFNSIFDIAATLPIDHEVIEVDRLNNAESTFSQNTFSSEWAKNSALAKLKLDFAFLLSTFTEESSNVRFQMEDDISHARSILEGEEVQYKADVCKEGTMREELIKQELEHNRATEKVQMESKRTRLDIKKLNKRKPKW